MSILVQGLDTIENKDYKINKMIYSLIELDKKLQEKHLQAKKNSEYGEKVVEMYENFLIERKHLIDYLTKLKINIPWQLHLTVDEFNENSKESLKNKMDIKKVYEKQKQQEQELEKEKEIDRKINLIKDRGQVQQNMKWKVMYHLVIPMLVAIYIIYFVQK